MKHQLTKITAMVLAAAMTVLCLAGCSLNTGRVSDDVAVIFEGEKIDKTEAALYVYSMQYETEKNSETLISLLYGDYASFWAQESSDGIPYSELCKQSAIARMIQTKTLNKKANAMGIKLDAEESARVEEKIASFTEEYAEIIEKSGASADLIRKYITENAMAVKAYLAIVADVDTAVDDDLMRRKSFTGISILGVTSIDADEDKGIEAEEVSEADAEANRLAARDKVLAALNEGKEISDITAMFTDDPYVTVSSIGANTAKSTDAAAEGETMTSYRQLAWTLSTGEVGMIDTKNSADKTVSYVLYMNDDDDADARADAVAEEISSRKAELFSEKYAELTAKYNDYHVYEDALTELKIVGGLFKSETLSESADE